MEQILEIRDGCSTPEQLLKSRAFSRYLNIYKKEFVEELGACEGRQRQEAQHRAAMFKDLSAREVLAILEQPQPATDEGMERARSVVRFLDGAFHYYRASGYKRLVRLQNDVVSTGEETPETVKDKVTGKARSLAEADTTLERRD